jgi:hypothetical protein
MKKNGLYIVLFALLMVLLFVPIIQQTLHPFQVKPLNGAVVKVEKPQLEFESYKDMSYQGQLEQYVASNFGFHEFVIRLYNQYVFLYRKTYANDVVIGKDKWLYSKKSVFDHYRQESRLYSENNEMLMQRFEKDLERLKKVQDLLDERGTKLFVLIGPSKDVVYPEHLPQNGNYVMGDGLRAIDYYPQAFAENGINFVDVCAWFQQMKDTVSYPLFPERGMHWSNLACIHASDSIIRYMEQLTGKNMPNLRIGSMFPDEPRNPDNDLEQNINLLWKIRPLEQNYYAQVEIIPDSTAQRLRLINMGDSFFWNMCYMLPMNDLFESYHYWYYFNTIYYDKEHTNVSQLDLIEELEQADVVMILLSANQLYDINHGFLSQALAKLSAIDPDELDNILESIKENMRANEVWFQSLKEKAEQQGKTLEQVMDEDALYVFNQNPENFLN